MKSHRNAQEHARQNMAISKMLSESTDLELFLNWPINDHISEVLMSKSEKK